MEGEAWHVIGAGESGGVPRLWVAARDAVRPLPAEGAFAWHVGGPRICVGRWHEGRHVPCPQGVWVGADARCAACSGLEHPECVFEPLCRNDPASCACATSFRGVEHVVYCAFHGTLPKVGMTQARRVTARLREQGADLWFVVARGLDRAGARALERAVSAIDGVPEYRSHRETLPQMARPVDWDVVESRAHALAQRLASRHPVDPTLHRIDDHPVRQPLPGRPRRIEAHGTHRGTWLGMKGNHLFYAVAPGPFRLDAGAPPVAAVKRTELVGRFLTVEGA